MAVMVEPCIGCGRILLIHPVANLKVRLDSFPLEPDEAVQALMSGRTLWRVTTTSVTGARPAELTALRERGSTGGPRIHQEHRCTAVSRPNNPSPVPSSQPVPPSPSAGRTETPSPGPQTEPSSAPGARPPATRSDRRPTCSGCGRPCADGTYASIALGELVVWAQHVDTCPA